jgi:hypothetical protein
MTRKRTQKKANPLKGFKPVLGIPRKKVPQAGYEAAVPTSREALLDVSRDAQRFYDLILEAGSQGMTRHEIMRTNPKYRLNFVTARIAELRTAGWVRHKVKRVGDTRTIVRRKDPETGKANTVVLAVPHFEETFTDTRFKALRAAYQDALDEQKRHLDEATAAKDAALEYLRRMHVKLRKIHT